MTVCVVLWVGMLFRFLLVVLMGGEKEEGQEERRGRDKSRGDSGRKEENIFVRYFSCKFIKLTNNWFISYN